MSFKKGLTSGLVAMAAIAGTVSRADAAMRDPDTGLGPIVAGIDYKYYTGAFTVMPNFSTLTPAKEDTCSVFDLTKLPHAATNFAFVFTGYFNVDIPDEFTFTLKSKDGAQLLIGDSIVVNNDGVHATPAEKSGTIGLNDGKHKLTLRFFGTTAPSLSFTFKAPIFGADPQDPASSMFRKFTGVIPEITIVNPKKGQVYRLGDTLTIQWNFPGGAGHTVFLGYSADNGKTFPTLISPIAVNQKTEFGEYKWVVPEEDSLKAAKAIIAVNDYVVGGPSDESDVFTMAAKGAGISPLGKKAGSNLTRQGNAFLYPLAGIQGELTLSLVNAKGETLALKGSAAAGSMRWEIPARLSGMHLAVLSVNGVQAVRRLVNFN